MSTIDAQQRNENRIARCVVVSLTVAALRLRVGGCVCVWYGLDIYRLTQWL